MGVYRRDYIIYGWNLPYDLKGVDWYDDKFLPLIEGHEGEDFALILDGMAGVYAVFGLLIQEADEDEGWDFQNLNIPYLNSEEVKKKYIEVFGLESNTELAEPNLFIFTHFS